MASFCSANFDEANIRTFFINRPNTRIRQILRYFNQRVQIFRGNQIVTSKYNFLTFLPLNMMLQFSKMANFYFLVLSVLECFPLVSDSSGFPVLLFPLSFVVGLSMIKDIYEDYQRHRSDSEENNRKAVVATHLNPEDEKLFT
jgi:phospholipid-transporting ATPase